MEVLSCLAIDVYQSGRLSLIFEQVGYQPCKGGLERQDGSNLLSQSVDGHRIGAKLQSHIDDFLRFDGLSLSRRCHRKKGGGSAISAEGDPLSGSTESASRAEGEKMDHLRRRQNITVGHHRVPRLNISQQLVDYCGKKLL